MFHNLPDNATVETVAAHFGVHWSDVATIETVGLTDPSRILNAHTRLTRRVQKIAGPGARPRWRQMDLYSPSHTFTFFKVRIPGEGWLTAYSRVTEV